MTFLSRFAIVLSCLLTFGCAGNWNQTSSPQAYVIALYDESAALTEAGDKWGRAMEPWFLGNEADIEEINAAKLNYEKTIESIRSSLKKRKIPDEPKAREFSVLVSDYLDWQLQVGDTLAKCFEIVQSENPAVVPTRQLVIDELHAIHSQELEWKSRINGLGEELGVNIKPEP
jgi:hypothetical protein